MSNVIAIKSDQIAEQIGAAIWDELGGYEATHPALNGATDAILARVMCVLNDNNCLALP